MATNQLALNGFRGGVVGAAGGILGTLAGVGMLLGHIFVPGGHLLIAGIVTTAASGVIALVSIVVARQSGKSLAEGTRAKRKIQQDVRRHGGYYANALYAPPIPEEYRTKTK